jgi:hypothetical protein
VRSVTVSTFDYAAVCRNERNDSLVSNVSILDWVFCVLFPHRFSGKETSLLSVTYHIGRVRHFHPHEWTSNNITC